MKKVLVGIILFWSFNVMAQDDVEAPQNLEQQFRTMIDNTETFKEYKVIKIEMLNNFWSVVEDSLQEKQEAIVQAKQKISEQSSRITSLNNTIDEGKASVEQAAYDREHINVIGIDFQKGTFILISFGLIGLLIAIIAVGFGKYKYNSTVAAEKARDYDKLEQEYKAYQDDSREKQMKLKREIQTYMNKLEEMNHKNISFK